MIHIHWTVLGTAAYIIKTSSYWSEARNLFLSSIPVILATLTTTCRWDMLIIRAQKDGENAFRNKHWYWRTISHCSGDAYMFPPIQIERKRVLQNFKIFKSEMLILDLWDLFWFQKTSAHYDYDFFCHKYSNY